MMSLQKRISRLEQRAGRQHATGHLSIEKAWQAADTTAEKTRVVRQQINRSSRQRPSTEPYDDMSPAEKRQLYEQKIRGQ